MATYVPAKKNTAFITYVGLPSQANALVLQANPTLAGGDVKVAIDDGDPANLATLPVVDANFTKRVKVSLSSDEMNGDNISIIFSDAAGDEWCDVLVNIQTAAGQIDDIPTTTEFELRTLVAADYTIVSDLGTVQSGDSYAIVNGTHGLVSIQDDVDAILVDTNETIPGLITAASPTLHTAASNTEVGNTTLDGGTYADTETNDDTNYYQTGPGTAVGGFGLNCVLGFELGIGRIPSTLTVDGHFDSGAQRTVQVWAYNYLTSAYVQLSNSATDFNNSASDSLRQYALTSSMVDQSTGAALIRFTSTSVTVSDVFEIDYCIINSVASAAAGLTANAIQAAVWNRTASGHDEDTLGYNLSKTHIMGGHIVSATSATQFIIDGTVAANDCLNGMIIMLEDKTDDHYEVRRIVDSITSTNEIFVDRAFGFTPVALDDFYIMSSGYGDVNVTHTAGSAYADTDLDTVLSKLNLITAMVV